MLSIMHSHRHNHICCISELRARTRSLHVCACVLLYRHHTQWKCGSLFVFNIERTLQGASSNENAFSFTCVTASTRHVRKLLSESN